MASPAARAVGFAADGELLVLLLDHMAASSREGEELLHLDHHQQQQQGKEEKQQEGQEEVQDQHPLYLQAARALHRVSKAHAAAAHRLPRRLNLARYRDGLLSAYPDPHTRPLPGVPWDTLAASPGVTAWKLNCNQVYDLVDLLLEDADEDEGGSPGTSARDSSAATSAAAATATGGGQEAAAAAAAAAGGGAGGGGVEAAAAAGTSSTATAAAGAEAGSTGNMQGGVRTRSMTRALEAPGAKEPLAAAAAAGPPTAAQAAAAVAAVRRLKDLEVMWQGYSPAGFVAGLGHLLAAATSLTRLVLRGWVLQQHACLLLHPHALPAARDPCSDEEEGSDDSELVCTPPAVAEAAAAAGEVGPSLQLRSLSIPGMPIGPLATWVQQQLAPTLTSLTCSPGFTHQDPRHLKCVTALTKLRQLDVRHLQGPLPAGLSATTSLTRLEVYSYHQEWPLAVSTLRQLRHLSLEGCDDMDGAPPAGYFAALSALTHLDLSNTWLDDPLDGLALPHLAELIINGCVSVPTLPVGLTRLRRLEAANKREGVPVNLPSLTGLRELDLSESHIQHPHVLSSLSNLELLKLAGCQVVGKVGLAAGQLGCLTRLRHLDLHMSYWGHAAAFASPGGLPHLTFLDVTASMADPAAVPRDWKKWAQPGNPDWFYRDQDSPSSRKGKGCKSREEALSRRAAAAVEGLLQLGPLPRLKHLSLALNQLTSLAPLGPWLAQCSALTQLNLSSNPLASAEQLDHLPEQLQALDLAKCGLTRLPKGLTILTGLRVLHLNDNPKLRQLPGWLSQLHRLEVLEVKGTGVVTQQVVLSHLPLLRSVALQEEGQEGEGLLSRVYGQATHLHWGDACMTW